MASRSRAVGERATSTVRRRSSARVLAVALLVAPFASGAGACGDDGGSDGDGVDGGPDAGRIPNLDGGEPYDAASPDIDGGVPPRRDGGVLCDDTVCDPRRPAIDARCGESERCRLVSAEPTCEAEVGPSGEGALCREIDQCAEGLACVARVNGAVCASVCCPGNDSHCAIDERCAEVAELVDGTPLGWGVCTKSRPCDVFSPGDACEPAEGCYLVDGDGETDCRAAGIAEVGQPCERQNDCVPGAFCGGVPGAGRCVGMCALEGEPGCPSSLRCAPFPPTTPEGIGLCIE